MPSRGQPWKEGGLVDETVTSEDIKEGTIQLTDLESSLQATAGSGGHGIEDEGVPLTTRPTLNFVGAGVVASDDGEKTVVTVSGGGGYDEIQDEGTPLTQRPRINFIGNGVTAVDNGGSNRTDVTIIGTEIDEFVFDQASVESVGVGDTSASPKILARWQVSNTSPIQQNFIMRDLILYAIGERLVGSGSVRIEFVRSTDNFATFANFIRLSFAGVQAQDSGEQSTSFGNTLTDIGIVAYNSDGATSGTLENMTFFMKNKVPSGMTFTRIV